MKTIIYVSVLFIVYGIYCSRGGEDCRGRQRPRAVLQLSIKVLYHTIHRRERWKGRGFERRSVAYLTIENKQFLAYILSFGYFYSVLNNKLEE